MKNKINITPQTNAQLSENDIAATEHVLGFSLPEELVKFLLTYGDAQFQENQHARLPELSIESVLLPSNAPDSIVSEWQKILPDRKSVV